MRHGCCHMQSLKLSPAESCHQNHRVGNPDPSRGHVIEVGDDRIVDDPGGPASLRNCSDGDDWRNGIVRVAPGHGRSHCSSVGRDRRSGKSRKRRHSHDGGKTADEERLPVRRPFPPEGETGQSTPLMAAYSQLSFVATISMGCHNRTPIAQTTGVPFSHPPEDKLQQQGCCDHACGVDDMGVFNPAGCSKNYGFR